jgi:acyl carrier protein
MEALKTELKNHIIEQMNLEDVKVEEIVDTEPLFGEGLGLDSIDALELIVMLETHYGIKIANPEEGKQIFESINALAEYVEANKA